MSRKNVIETNVGRAKDSALFKHRYRDGGEP